MSVDVADPWNNTSDCYAGLFHFVNEAYDLGYPIGRPQSPSSTSNAHQQPSQPQQQQQQRPRRRRQRLRFARPSWERSVQNDERFREQYLRFSVAPDQFARTTTAATAATAATASVTTGVSAAAIYPNGTTTVNLAAQRNLSAGGGGRPPSPAPSLPRSAPIALLPSLNLGYTDAAAEVMPSNVGGGGGGGSDHHDAFDALGVPVPMH